MLKASTVPAIVRRDLKLDVEGIFDTMQKFYKEVMAESPSVPSNGGKVHQGNGGQKSPSSNGNATQPAATIKPVKR